MGFEIENQSQRKDAMRLIALFGCACWIAGTGAAAGSVAPAWNGAVPAHAGRACGDADAAAGAGNAEPWLCDVANGECNEDGHAAARRAASGERDHGPAHGGSIDAGYGG